MPEKTAQIGAVKASTRPLQCEQIAGLRDFFASKNSCDLQAAYERLRGDFSGQPINWHDVEYLFNRLFVGPMAVEAPPYASIYLDEEAQVMGRVTLQVRDVYDALSLKAPSLEHNGVLPDDHIALELDALVALLAVQDWCHEIHGSSVVEKESRMYLTWLSEHMAIWIPQFTAKICTYTEKSTISRDCKNIFNTTTDILSKNIKSMHQYYGNM